MVQKPKSRLTTTKLKVQSVRLFSNPAPLDPPRLDDRHDILFANAGRPTRGWQAIPCEGRRPDHVTPQLQGAATTRPPAREIPQGPRGGRLVRSGTASHHATCGCAGADCTGPVTGLLCPQTRQGRSVHSVHQPACKSAGTDCTGPVTGLSCPQTRQGRSVHSVHLSRRACPSCQRNRAQVRCRSRPRLKHHRSYDTPTHPHQSRVPWRSTPRGPPRPEEGARHGSILDSPRPLIRPARGLGSSARQSKFVRQFLRNSRSKWVQKSKSRLTTTQTKVRSVRLFSTTLIKSPIRPRPATARGRSGPRTRCEPPGPREDGAHHASSVVSPRPLIRPAGTLGQPARQSTFVRRFLHSGGIIWVRKPKSRLTATKPKVQSVRLFSQLAPRRTLRAAGGRRGRRDRCAG